MRKIILILVMLLAVLIPTLTLTSVNADEITWEDFENNSNNASNNLLIEQDLTQILIDDFDVKRTYSNLYFKYNNFGLWSNGIDFDDCKFWGKVITDYNSNHDDSLIGCEIIFTIFEPITCEYFTYKTGFSFNDERGTFNQYVNDDVCVLLGSQIVDFKSGMKTYLMEKDIEDITFNIVAFEMYVRTQNVKLSYPNDIEYYYVNDNHSLDEKAKEYIYSINRAVKPRAVISTPYNTLTDTYNSGFNEGKNVGIQEGFENGYNVGQEEGYNSGYSKGNSEGYNEGFENGYDLGYEDCGAVANLPGIIPDTFNSVWHNVFEPVFDFEILGLQIGDIFSVIIGFGLLWAIIKILKGIV